MSDWDLLCIVTAAHWLPVTRSGAVIVLKTGLFFPVSPAYLNSHCSLFQSLEAAYTVYKTLFTSLYLKLWNIFLPLLFISSWQSLYPPFGFARSLLLPLCFCTPVHSPSSRPGRPSASAFGNSFTSPPPLSPLSHPACRSKAVWLPTLTLFNWFWLICAFFFFFLRNMVNIEHHSGGV